MLQSIKFKMQKDFFVRFTKLARIYAMINLVCSVKMALVLKTTKLYFSSQVRKQFKLLAVPFKPLRCCLRNDKLVNCHV